MLFDRPSVLQLFRTEAVAWVFPSRLLLGILMLFPFAGNAEEVWNSAGPVPIGALLRVLEIVAALGLMSGFLIRVVVYPAVLLFLVHMLAGAAGSAAWFARWISPLIIAKGDWAYAATDLGAIALLLDVVHRGSGLYSLDYLIYQRLAGRMRTDN